MDKNPPYPLITHIDWFLVVLCKTCRMYDSYFVFPTKIQVTKDTQKIAVESKETFNLQLKPGSVIACIDLFVFTVS